MISSEKQSSVANAAVVSFLESVYLASLRFQLRFVGLHSLCSEMVSLLESVYLVSLRFQLQLSAYTRHCSEMAEIKLLSRFQRKICNQFCAVSYVFFNVFFHLPTDDILSTAGRFFLFFLHIRGFFAGDLHLSVFYPLR